MHRGVAVTGCSDAAQPSVPDTTSPAYVQRQIALGQFIPACPDAVSRGEHCLALGIRDKSLVPMSENDGGGAVSGYGPAQLQAAYHIATAAKQKSGGLVAVIEFGGDPNLIGDLAVYRKQFGLPACGKKRACIRVVNQEGKPSPLPPTNAEWLAEQSLDVDMVSANCPHCRILVVEAHSDLDAAALVAQSFKPVAISASWGGGEYNGEQSDQYTYFSDPGVAITASAGDGGYGVIFPSAANTVSAIGGTTLVQASGSRGYSETVWSGSGSGCSALHLGDDVAAADRDATRRLQQPHCFRRRVRREPEHRRRGVRDDQGRRRAAGLAGLGRHERRLTRDRRHLRDLEEPFGRPRLDRVRESERSVRRDERKQRRMYAGVSLHRRGRLRRTDGPRDAERRRRVLASLNPADAGRPIRADLPGRGRAE